MVRGAEAVSPERFEMSSGRVGKSLGFGLVAGMVVACLIVLTSAAGPAILFTSWASSVALVLTNPSIRSSAPHRVGFCHALTALIGLSAHAVLPGFALAVGTAVGISVALALIGDLMHPPAIANAAFAFVSNAPADKFAIAAVLGGILLAGFAALNGRRLRRAGQSREMPIAPG